MKTVSVLLHENAYLPNMPFLILENSQIFLQMKKPESSLLP